MKVTFITLIIPALLVIGAKAVTQAQKAVIVSYSENTPDSVIDSAMSAIKAGGGTITHKYTLFKGFAAQAPATALDTVQVMGNDYHAVIEEDQVVSANGEASS